MGSDVRGQGGAMGVDSSDVRGGGNGCGFSDVRGGMGSGQRLVVMSGVSSDDWEGQWVCL